RPGPARPGLPPQGPLAWAATLCAALVGRAVSGLRPGEPGWLPLSIRPAEVRIRPRRPPPRALTVLVVDVSGSMGLRALGIAKGLAESWLQRAYQKREEIGLIAVGGRAARCLRRPTASPAGALAAVRDLAGGGGTPLPAGLALAQALVRDGRRRNPGLRAQLLLLTDGRPNVPLPEGGPGGTGTFDQPARAAWEQTIALGRALRSAGVSITVLDVTPSAVPAPSVRALASALGAPLLNRSGL
ncbi:MAG TPA: VWA domain-containing protein, partial [Limnochordia bacterium]